MKKSHHTVLITTVTLAAFVLGWISGLKFGFDGVNSVGASSSLKCSESSRNLEIGKCIVADSIVTPVETDRPTSWEAAAATGFQWRGLRESSAAQEIPGSPY